jgi:hypothetical protein
MSQQTTKGQEGILNTSLNKGSQSVKAIDCLNPTK